MADAKLRSRAPAGNLPAGTGDAEFSFGPADFERVRMLIHRKAGIHLQENKSAMVYSRLSRRLREVGERSFSAYLDRLDDDLGNEWQEFVNCLTTNLTSFFRERHHFEELTRILAGRRRRPTAIWCNAASTGEEPWSIAMTVVETLGEQASASLLCTDIDTRVLAAAERGVYPVDAGGLDPEQRQRFFLRGTGSNLGRMRIRPELRRLAAFRALNLMDGHYDTGEPVDIVFCRNVMIYFDAPTQRAVLERMHARMAPGALLFAGHSENFAHARDLFTLRGKTIYARV